MLVQVVKSKIHRVKVTGADLNYIRSITIDENLMDAANIIEGERAQIVNAFIELENAKTFKPALVFPNEATNTLL